MKEIYDIEVIEKESWVVQIEAESEEEAEKIASEMYLEGSLERPDEDEIEYCIRVNGTRIL